MQREKKSDKCRVGLFCRGRGGQIPRASIRKQTDINAIKNRVHASSWTGGIRESGISNPGFVYYRSTSKDSDK